MKIHTEIYLDTMNALRPKVEKFAHKFGRKDFNKFCFFGFRQKLKDKEYPSLGKICTAVIFCLSSDYDNEMLKKFSTQFVQMYEKAIVEEKDLNKIQNYRLKQNIMIQFYDPMERIDLMNPHLPNFYTSFASEGLVLNTSADYNPLKVKYSFRFDQVVQCTGDEASTLKKVLNPIVSKLFRADECCISYLVDWNQNGVKNMFCSMYLTPWKCHVDIKIFQSTLYHYCLTQQIEKTKKKKIKNKDLGKMKMYFLERATVISTLREIDNFNLYAFLDKQSYFYNLVAQEKKTVKADLFSSLVAFNQEVTDKNSRLNDGCTRLMGNIMSNQGIYNSSILAILKKH